MLQFIRNLMPSHRAEDGASAVEYGLLVAGIAALIVAVVFLFGNMVSDVFSGTCQNIKDSASGVSIGSCS